MKLRLFQLLLLLVSPVLLQAETFTISDQNGEVQLQFVVPGSPEVLDESDGEYFVASGSSDVFGDLFVGFGSPDYFAQLILGGSFGLVSFNAPQLYTGSEAAPTLVNGQYDITSLEGLSYTLRIAGDTAVTPEPSCLLLCATGAALLMGAFLQRHSRHTRHVPAPQAGAKGE